METLKLNSEEHLLQFVDEHWMIMLRPFSLYLVGLGLSAVLFWFGITAMVSSPLLGMVFFLVSFFTCLVSTHWFFLYWISLNLSGWAITNKRIIDFSFLPYVKHDMTYLSIRDVAELEKQQHGLLKNFLHYGEVELNFTASQENTTFKYVPYPGRFVDLVSRLQKEVK